MVQLKEVEDELFTQEQPGPILDDNDDDYYTDTGTSLLLGLLSLHSPANLFPDSEISSDDEADLSLEETLADRLTALRDVIPPKQRAALTSSLSTAASWMKSGLSWSGSALFVISTSVLLFGVPFALANLDEMEHMEREREEKMRQGATDVLTPGVGSALTQQQAKPAV
ncbi:MAG: mitochondrial import receptor protein [Candelina mexicana]|nr:MAG: mitochondrial import receptor protein [Candelina mexicana]